ncbi:MBL fold metallo-hydrolase [Candidatus Bipolaricaulota bacterium]
MNRRVRRLSIVFALLGLVMLAVTVQASTHVDLQYLGHMCILIAAPDGTTIVCDPYHIIPGVEFGLTALPSDVAADAVTVTHAHVDHNNTTAFPGATVINAPGEYQIGAATITGYDSFHGEEGEMSAQPNVVFVIEVAGVKIVHFGDSVVVTDEATIAEISNADVALLNIDPYVIPLTEGMPFMDHIGARTIIPSHYTHGSAAAGPQFVSLQAFLNRLDSEVMVSNGATEIRVNPGMPRQVVVLKPLFLDSN